MCWYSVYDLIASRYNFTFDQFCKLTFKQINNLATKATESIIEDRKFKAALHGRELEEAPNLEDDWKIDDTKKEELEAIAQKQFEQWPTIKI